MDGHIDAIAITGQIFINGIIEDFGDTVVQRAFISPADVHAGLLPNGLQALQFSQLRGSILTRHFGRKIRFFVCFEHVFLRHNNRSDGTF